MDEITTTCPSCHQPIFPTNYYCANCGKNLRPVPPSTTVTDQVWLYLKSLLLPPMGIIWGFRYLRQPDTRSKVVGLIAIVITLVEIVWLVQSTVYTVNTVNQQINQQFKIYGL